MARWEKLFSRNNKNDNLQNVPNSSDNSNQLKTDNITDDKKNTDSLTQTVSSIVVPSEHPLNIIYTLYNNIKNQNSFLVNMLSSPKNFEIASIYNNKSEAEKILKMLHIFSTRRINHAFLDKTQQSLQDLDEEIFIHVSSDKMLAWISIFPPIGKGKTLISSQILQILIDRGVSFGIDFDLLYSLPNDKKRYFCLFLIACGKPPIDGEDGHIVELYSRDVYTHMEKAELSHVDYARLNLSRKIQKGGVICEIIPPTLGISGITVTRDLLLPPPKDGQAANIPKGRNTGLSKDGRYLIAEKTGNVDYSGGNFQVKPILEIFNGIKSSDEQHDINFLGDIHIHGDACVGVTIRATGDVQVDGVVEACNIEAGENIIALGGVQGQHNATIRAHKGIYAKYLEHCTAYAQDVVQADCIIDFNIYSNGTVTARTGLGVITCGTIRSSKEISAKVVGSKAEQQINIILGGIPCDEVDIENIQAELNEITKKIQIVSARPKSPTNDETLAKLRLSQCVAKMKLDKIQKEFDKYVESMCLDNSCTLTCEKIYSGAIITIDKMSFNIEDEKTNCTIGLRDDGKINFI